jgi:DNA-binding NarL/FixJ family response regulator
MRVLVADDHALFRDGLVSLLEAAGFDVVAELGDGAGAVEAALRLRPDVTLLDLAMPGVSGLQALGQIRAAWPEATVVILTASEDDDSLFAASAAGASGYLLKSLKADEFVDMLRGLERGQAAMTRQTTARLLAGLSRPPPSPRPAAGVLTPQEVEVLQLLASGLSNKAIAREVALSENTVKYHIKHILHKLGLSNRTAAAAYAIWAGLHVPHYPDG